MKVTQLELSNITRYKQTSMAFPSPLSVIVGSNADGKTTIYDAITALLTGANDRTDKAGKGQEAFVSYGEQQGSISASISNNGAEPIVVTRFIPGELLIEGMHGNKTILQAGLCKYLGADMGALSAALSTTAFIDAKPSDQKSLLFGLLGLEAGGYGFIDEITAAVPEGLQEAARAYLEGKMPNALYVQGGIGEIFTALHKYVYDARRDVKRDLKNMGELPAATLVDEPLPLQEGMKKMSELRGLKAGLESQVSEARANVSLRDKLVSEIAELRERLEEAGDPETAREQLQKDAAVIQDLQKQIAAYIATARSQELAADSFEGAALCPIPEDLEIACGMAKTKREKLIVDLRSKADASADLAKEVQAELAPLKNRRASLEEEAYRPSRTETEAAIEAKEADLAALPATDVDLPKIEAEISTLFDRITNGEQKIADMNRELGARTEREKVEAKRSQLESQVEVLEALVEVLSPSGLPGKILSETIGPIQEQANARLQELTGGRYSLEMVLEPDFAIFVSHDGVRTDLKRLSSSERMRVGVVLQSVLVGLTGLRFMVVDNVDLLDKTNRDLFLDALLSMRDDFDQIICLSTIGPNGVSNPHIPDVAIYQLVNGALEEVA